MSLNEKWEKYQFTLKERKEIISSVEEYFDENKNQQFKRYDKLVLPTQSWYQKWISKKNFFFNFFIKMKLWCDNSNNNINKIKEIYLNENFYDLLPFENTTSYTKKVMKKFLKTDDYNYEDKYIIKDKLLEDELTKSSKFSENESFDKKKKVIFNLALENENILIEDINQTTSPSKTNSLRNRKYKIISKRIIDIILKKRNPSTIKSFFTKFTKQNYFAIFTLIAFLISFQFFFK